MNQKALTKLARFASQCEDLAREIRNMLRQEQPCDARPVCAENEPDIEQIVQDIKRQSKEQVIQRLDSLSKNLISKICRSLGGSCNDTKKTKEDIKKKIIFILFDFNAGHSILKNDNQRPCRESVEEKNNSSSPNK
jgi:hypothetical protein